MTMLMVGNAKRKGPKVKTERDKVLKEIEATKLVIDDSYAAIGELNNQIELAKKVQREAQDKLSELIRKLSDLSR